MAAEELSTRKAVVKKTVCFEILLKFELDVIILEKIVKLFITNLVSSASFHCEMKAIFKKNCSEDQIPILQKPEVAASEDKPINFQCLYFPASIFCVTS